MREPFENCTSCFLIELPGMTPPQKFAITPAARTCGATASEMNSLASSSFFERTITLCLYSKQDRKARKPAANE